MHSTASRRAQRCLSVALAGGATLALVGGLAGPAAATAPDTQDSLSASTLSSAAPASAQRASGQDADDTARAGSETVILAEDFESADGAASPEGWAVEHDNVDGMREGWAGWVFRAAANVVEAFGASGDRDSFHRAEGLTAVVHSDGNRPSEGRFNSTLWSPEVAVGADALALAVAFDSHYKQGQSPQRAQLVVSFNGRDPVIAQTFNGARLDARERVVVDVPEGATSAQFGWQYLDSSNNWFWMIDNVEVTESEPADVTPTITSGRKPVARPGESLDVTLEGLRPNQQITAMLGGEGHEEDVEVDGIPAADDAGAVSFSVSIAADQAPGTLPLTIAGDGVVPTVITISVLGTGSKSFATTEPKRWFDGFEEVASWSTNGDTEWGFATRDEIVDRFGTDRRHAFTRASGTIAVAEATNDAFDGVLTSAPVEVTPGEELELRFDSHYRVRGVQHGRVTAIFDTGQKTVLTELVDDEGESTQLRLPVDVPETAKTVQFAFAFTGEAGAGSWMIDDAQLVEPLAGLAADAEPRAIVDAFSDVQGANGRLRDQVLPGLRGMSPQADVIVSNGDLTSNGTQSQYAAYFDAFAAGGGNEYGTQISTIGNHEFYGHDGSEAYIDRFLDSTDMRDIGGQGGLWGEVVVDGELPVLWIGSEYHDYASQTGSGPFVEMSDEQFEWLENRLAHYGETNTPVVLFAHHVFENSVSGTYINFYKNEYGADQERMEALLAQSPHVTVMSSHTHWSAELGDWSVEQRFDPAAEFAPTIVNTAAVTTMYGPSGDWGETAVGGADPVALRLALYDDRLRVSAHSFGAGGEETPIRHVDVALPAASENTEKPEQPDNEKPDTEKPDTEDIGTEDSDTDQPGASGSDGTNTSPSDEVSGETRTGPKGTTLATTGAKFGALAAVAASLIAAGGAALWARARRRTGRS